MPTEPTMTSFKPHIGHLVLLTSFIANTIVSGMGFANSACYYGHWLEAFGEESWLTSMVGSLNIAAVCVAGPLAGAMINSFGYRATVLSGSVLSLISFVIASYSPNIYVLLIFYSLSGLGWGFVFTPLCLAFTHYFHSKYHGICIGLIMCGSGFGHFLTPPIADWLTQEYTWRGALLIQGALSAQTFLLGASLRPMDSMKQSTTNGRWKLALFRNKDFLALLAHTLLFTTGLSVIFVHIAYSIEKYTNATPQQTALAVSAIGLSSLFGKVFHSIISKLKGVNAVLQTLITAVVEGICTIIIPYVEAFWVMIVISVVIGFCSGPYAPVLILITLSTVKADDVPSAWGYVNLMGGIGLYIGAPIAGALYDKTQNYFASMIFGGVLFICSGLVFVRSAVVWQRRMNETVEEIDLEERNSMVNEEVT